jgi:hypothetical protein
MSVCYGRYKGENKQETCYIKTNQKGTKTNMSNNQAGMRRMQQPALRRRQQSDKSLAVPWAAIPSIVGHTCTTIHCQYNLVLRALL